MGIMFKEKLVAIESVIKMYVLTGNIIISILINIWSAEEDKIYCSLILKFGILLRFAVKLIHFLGNSVFTMKSTLKLL